jgi:hypothetical protein
MTPVADEIFGVIQISIHKTTQECGNVCINRNGMYQV